VTLPAIIWGGRRWILASVFLFLLGIGLGWAASQADPELLVSQLQPVIERLGGLGSQVTQSSSPAERTWIIYRNNAQAVSVMMIAALVLPLLGALVPALGMFGNGALIGVVLGLGARLTGRAVDPGQLAIGLVPHGLFELPAIWLSAAWSMRLGLRWVAPSAGGNRWETWKQCAREAVIVLTLAMLLLGIAAFIEGNLTLALVRASRTDLQAILWRSF
jgi:stage II sporulation protein M